MDITSNAGGDGSFSFDDSSSHTLPSTGRGRVRSADFGLPERSGLIVLADAAVSGTLACRTGYTLAKTIVERREEFGVS